MGIGTNRLISEKIVSWDFAPPFDFVASFLARRARRRGEQTIALASKKSGSLIWWNYTTPLEHFLNGTDRLRFAPAERSGAAEFPPHPPSVAPSREAKLFAREAGFTKTLL